MATTKPTLVGVFDNATAADSAIQNLENTGFDANQIYYSNHHASEGGFIGGLKSLFTGEDTASVSNDLAGLGLSNDEANYYEDQYKAGRVVVAVRGNGREQEAAQILQANGAHTYGTQAGAAQTGYADTDNRSNTGSYGSTADAGAYTSTNDTGNYDTDEQRRLRLREEQLNVSKERVQAGEVGLHKDVISEQKTVNVPVSHEEVYVERRAVSDGQVDDATPIGEGDAIRVPVSAEQVNVDKNTVVTGEVAIGKRNVQETQQVSDTVRREEARVDQQGDLPVHDTTNENVRSDRTDDRNL
jgi:uncharacterized protein (TIGR02271 family)